MSRCYDKLKYKMFSNTRETTRVGYWYYMTF